MPNPENVIGKGRKFRADDAATKEAARKGALSPKRKATVNAKRIMNKLLTSCPPMTDKIVDSMRAIGVDINDEELKTTAGMIEAVLIAQALNGDKEAVRMVLEIAGETTSIRDAHDAEKIKLEARKVSIEEKRASGLDAESSEAFNELTKVITNAIK